MEFKDLFVALGLVAIAIFGFLGFANEINTQWGTSIGSDLEETASLSSSITGNLSSQASVTSSSGFPEEGQAEGSNEEGLLSRARNILGTLPRLAGLPGKLIRDAGNALNIVPFIVDIAVWTFNFVFFITLGYLFITGSRRLIGR